MSTNKAAVLQQPAGSLVIEEIKIPEIGPSEVLIKNHAIALNPADWKMRKFGVFVDKYPIILGSDVAGVIERVGSAVSKYKVGDRVSGFAHILISKDSRNGAFQEYSAVEESGLTKLPDHVSFEKGSVLPMGVATAGAAIFIDLDVPRVPNKQSGGFLVWGASSSVGSAAVQIARKLGFTVFAICSSRHHDMVQKLGASACFDYNDPSVVQKVTAAAKTSNEKINIGYDAISEHNSSPQSAAILSAFGGGKLGITLPYPDGEKPANVELLHTFAMRVVADKKDVGLWLFGHWLASALLDSSYVPSPEIELIHGGLEALQGALEAYERKGVSGKKLVLPLL